MKPPPLTLAAALLFWGWHADLLMLAAIAAGVIELAHAVSSRWEFSDKEFNRLWDVCTVIFLMAAVYLRLSEDLTSAAYKFFQWMPLIFYPMALGYMFGTRDTVPLSAFSWFARRDKTRENTLGVAFGWLYFGLCLISAGATNVRTVWFYVGFMLLTGIALWTVRPGRIPGWAWAGIFLAVAVAGFYGQSRLPEAQAFLESKASDLFVRWSKRDFEASQSKTAMGRIGALKRSSRIVMKVKVVHGKVPERLRQCTYVRLEETTWQGSRGTSFEPVPIESDTTTWTFLTNAHGESALRIIERANRKSALLSIPLGTSQLRELAAGSVETNSLGVVRASENPGLLNYLVFYGDQSWELHGIAWDKRIPDEEYDAIEAVARELDIAHAPPESKAEAIVRFFHERFRYTTYQEARALGIRETTPLSEFLLKTRAGHCEYFASATVLLLRYFDLPARYVTGYALQEYSSEEDCYIVREHHGHAWAVAWIGGKWVEVDSTPPDWGEAERKEFPFYQDFKDAWARLSFGFLEWRWLGDWNFIRLAAPWLAAPLTGFLIWRIFGRRMARREPRPREARTWPGADSDFFALERRLARDGLERRNQETTAQWLDRVAAEMPGMMENLKVVTDIHFRYRFDPRGISPSERRKLRELARDCIEQIQSAGLPRA